MNDVAYDIITASRRNWSHRAAPLHHVKPPAAVAPIKGNVRIILQPPRVIGSLIVSVIGSLVLILVLRSCGAF